MERKRHMVDISDAAWKKLERLAGRLDATQFVYKGRPRYGKLIELAIEKLEDSTMEWTTEEVWVDGTEDEETIEWDSKKEWWKGDKLDKYKPGNTGNEVPVDALNSKEWWLANPNITPIQAGQAAQDMALYGNSYIGTDYAKESDFPAIFKPIKAKDITFKVSAHYPAAEEWAKLSETVKKMGASASGASEATSSLADSFAAQASKDIASGMAQYLANAVEDAILGNNKKNPDPATIHEADVWTYPSNGKFTSVGNTLKLFARTDKEWTSKQIEQAQDAVSYAISGAAWFVKPFHTSFVSGMNFYEYTAIIEMHNSGVIDFVIERAKSSLKHALIELGLSGTKQHPPLHKIKAEYDAKKSTNPVPYTMWKASEPGYIELTGSITQALSAPQYDILRGFAYAAFAEFSSDEGESALSVTVKKVPWNKLWISATYADPSMLLKKLQDVAEAVSKKVEAWLLQGNFVGPLPQAVNIAEDGYHYVKVNVDSLGDGTNIFSLTCDISTGLSSEQKEALIQYMRKTADDCAKSYKKPYCYATNFPWNKLVVTSVFDKDVVIHGTLDATSKRLRKALEAWLVNRGLIGPLAKDLF